MCFAALRSNEECPEIKMEENECDSRLELKIGETYRMTLGRKLVERALYLGKSSGGGGDIIPRKHVIAFMEKDGTVKCLRFRSFTVKGEVVPFFPYKGGKVKAGRSLDYKLTGSEMRYLDERLRRGEI